MRVAGVREADAPFRPRRVEITQRDALIVAIRGAPTEVWRLHACPPVMMRVSPMDSGHSLADVDFDSIIGRAIDSTMRHEPIARIECLGLHDGEAVVLGDRDRLEAAFSGLLLACVRRTRRGAAVRVVLRRESGRWSVQIEHPTSPARQHSGATNLDGELTFARDVIDAHAGTVSAVDDPTRGVYVLRVSVPASDASFIVGSTGGPAT
jgi:hypothetical protein